MGRDWTDKLRERMQDYKEPEPEGLWEAISGSLDKAVQPGRQTGARTPREKRKNIFIISSLAAAAAVLLVVYFSFSNHDTSAVRTMHYTALADNGENAVLVDYRPERPAPLRQTARPQATYIPQDTVTEVSDETVSDGTAAGITGEHPAKESASKQENGANDMSGQEGWTMTDKYGDFDDSTVSDAEYRPGNKKERRIHASISASNLPGANTSYPGYAGLASAFILSSKELLEEDSPAYSQIPVKSASRSYSETLNTEIRHRQPVRVGLSVRYDLGKHWGIETGLTYSMLSSSISSGSNEYSFRTEQDLHYIGIPLQASYDFFRSRWFSLYANAGGMVEKCVYGKSSTDYVYGGDAVANETSDIRIRQLQWSVNAAIGAEISFTPLVGLYVEPGVSYFFNDGSDVQTIYKERPVNFNIEFGIRFSFPVR